MSYIDHGDIKTSNIKDILSFTTNVLQNPRNAVKYTNRNRFHNLKNVETKKMKGTIGLTASSKHDKKLHHMIRATGKNDNHFCILVHVNDNSGGKSPVAVGYSVGKQFIIDFNNVLNGYKPRKIMIDNEWKPRQHFSDSHIAGWISDSAELVAFVLPSSQPKTSSFNSVSFSDNNNSNSSSSSSKKENIDSMNDSSNYVNDDMNDDDHVTIEMPKINVNQHNLFSGIGGAINNESDDESDESIVDDDGDDIDVSSDEEEMIITKKKKVVKKISDDDNGPSKRTRNTMRLKKK